MMNGIDLSSQFSSFFTNTILDSFVSAVEDLASAGGTGGVFLGLTPFLAAATQIKLDIDSLLES